MPSKPHSIYRCTECGTEHPKWVGRCEGCGAWNSVAEEPGAKRQRGGRAVGRSAAPPTSPPVRLFDVGAEGLRRWKTGLDEFDFVLGGGVVPASLTIIGGEPGIGKSTLLLQASARLEAAGITTMYVSGEESPEQVRLRADRIAEDCGAVHLLPEVRLEAIIAHAATLGARAMVVDSIQTTYSEDLEGAPGNVGQVRECAARLMRFAKETGTAVFLVGHVTRGGVIAGPKTLEHIADTVVYFEGDVAHDYRVLRAVKNRFGSVDEVGVFAMTSGGLRPVPNPSAAFLSGRDPAAPGSAITALMEGTRPVLVEVQALAVRSSFGTPQRVANGLDQRRLALLLAVAERRAALPFHELDVFVNVTGGVRLDEPASDLAVIAALCSSVRDRAVPADAIFLGEVGLGGEIRPAAGLDRRLTEAARLGFRRAFLPLGARTSAGVETVPVAHVADLASQLAA
ncbi:MAG TPA: DNA repair protein RadA [Gemmatimonadales bacterium]|nr:DNA repair protein RadA [Gemmatimonadales bacterium]